MHSAIESMLSAYECRTISDYKNALKEIVQEIALLGLYRGGFFHQAAFYGGTALRIFHNMDRFSEDLDFSLIEPEPSFELTKSMISLRDELGAYGFEMNVEERIKNNKSTVKSAFIKGGTEIHLLKIKSISPPIYGVHPNEQIKVKLEVDTDPPAGAEYETKYQLNPLPYYVRLYTPSSLFAGKVHALLCRGWKSRVKGRDFYDYIWFLSKGISLNLKHLRLRMIQSGHLSPKETLDGNALQYYLEERFNSLDFGQVKKDVLPYLRSPDVLQLWSAQFFINITKDKLKIE
jgi:predicted nucleotidyltransferase component of viral defense system